MDMDWGFWGGNWVIGNWISDLPITNYRIISSILPVFFDEGGEDGSGTAV